MAGWRQHEHLLRRVKNIAASISKASAGKSPRSKQRMKSEYGKLLKYSRKILQRAEDLVFQLQDQEMDITTLCRIADLNRYIELTRHVCGTAHRRVIEGETVPNEDKIFSVFETHTQLYRRGKAGQPNQFGRLAMVFEDAAGFISNYHLLARDAQDADVVVEQTRIVQERHQNNIENASFDRGFYSVDNERQLRTIISHPCLPKKAPHEYAEQMQTSSVSISPSSSKPSRYRVGHRCLAIG